MKDLNPYILKLRMHLLFYTEHIKQNSQVQTWPKIYSYKIQSQESINLTTSINALLSS